MNERVAAFGSIMFLLGAVINLSAIGAAAAGNAPFAISYFSPGLALEIVSFIVLGIGILTKSKPRAPSHGQKTPVSEPLHDSS